MQYLRGVTTLQLDADLCIGCELCTQVCPHAVFMVENGKAKIVDRDSCMECGACAQNCPVDAIQVDAGVGCATGIMIGALRGSEPTCVCGSGSGDSCC